MDKNTLYSWIFSAINDAGRLFAAVALIALPGALLMMHLHTQYQITSTGYAIARVTRTHRVLTEEQRKLQVEAAVQGRTERVTSVAREQFGLEPIRHDQVTIIELPAQPRHASDTPARVGAEHASLVMSR